MKILQLSQQLPFPETDGGKIGIASIFKGLSKLETEVTFLCYNALPTKKETILEAEKYGKIIQINHPIKNTPSRIFKSVFDYKPIYIRKHFNNSIKKQIKEIINGLDFDIIHTDHTAMSELALYIQSLTNKPISLRLHNIEWTIWDRYINEIKFLPKKLYIKRQAYLLKKYEEGILNKFDILLPITKNDFDYLQKFNLGSKIVIAEAGVDTEKWIPNAPKRNKNEIIIATTYNWVHNVDGIKWFIEKVLPIIKRYNPDAFLTLLGKNMPSSLKRYNQNDVNAVGFVESIEPYLNNANIYITPLFVGAGMRIKILEAMSMELPVVATPIAAEGIDFDESNGLLIADNEYDFAHYILKLMNDDEYRDDMGRIARQSVQNTYTWDNSIKKIYNAYLEYLTKK